ncbi:hypothetical protein L3Q82_002278 [Scortum barcoo]|uniref:Uncharacterized protein n=1 Tax=Scortum barcoo TaxID=214431 RepID=A0ACB8VYM7_9TELE|nr:hypothetical protein L3Q82_002278 [Scortum barcoo]
MLRRLGSFGVCRPLLRTFYETVVASVVSYAVVCWGGGCSERDKKRLNRLIKRASSVCGCPLDSIKDGEHLLRPPSADCLQLPVCHFDAANKACRALEKLVVTITSCFNCHTGNAALHPLLLITAQREVCTEMKHHMDCERCTKQFVTVNYFVIIKPHLGDEGLETWRKRVEIKDLFMHRSTSNFCALEHFNTFVKEKTPENLLTSTKRSSGNTETAAHRPGRLKMNCSSSQRLEEPTSTREKIRFV